MAENKNYVKFLTGTKEQYTNLTSKDANTLYFITINDNTAELYLGAKQITATHNLSDLLDVLIGTVADNDLLVYSNGKWVNTPLNTLLETVTEAEYR